MLLSGVYSATELYMLTDYSPGLADTWQALDRRVQDVMRLGQMAEQVLPGPWLCCACTLHLSCTQTAQLSWLCGSCWGLLVARDACAV